MKLNYGCGETKLEGYVNIDIEPSTKPDLIHDIRKAPLPYEDNSVEDVLCLHNIEHIELKFWPVLFQEFHRVLSPEGTLTMAYPEFEVCAKNFVENKQGHKEFWRRTLYGRQKYPGDYHITPVISQDLVLLLKDAGFKDIKHRPEVDEPHNSFLVAVKDETKGILRDQENLINEEVFHGK